MRHPLLPPLVPADATVATAVVGVKPEVLPVVAATENAQIAATIVQPIAVDVVRLSRVPSEKAEYLAMHANRSTTLHPGGVSPV